MSVKIKTDKMLDNGENEEEICRMRTVTLSDN